MVSGEGKRKRPRFQQAGAALFIAAGPEVAMSDTWLFAISVVWNAIVFAVLVYIVSREARDL